jgi:methionyl-tRNA synthetase
MPKFYLTTPIFYLNAKPHIGHAYTTVAADVIARYQKQKLGKNNVFFLTGTDEHGAKNAEAAAKTGQDPKTFCDKMIPFFQKTWANLGIEYNHFIRTTDDYHASGAQKFLAQLKQKRALYQGNYTGLYCTGCESFLTTKQLDKLGRCPDHQRTPEKLTEKNWFFKLSDYLDKVKDLIENNILKVEPKQRKQEVLGLFKQGMENFSVSRPNVRWGIPLPWDRTQTIYVWVEALLNYWTALFKYQISNIKNQKYFWPPNLQLIGKDIIKFHCIYWPAMLLAYFDGDESKLPNKIFAHGFFTINGQKMSKTIGNVIDPNDLVKKYGNDGTRYLILSQFPFGQDGDIEQSKFDEKYNADLANGVGNLVARVTSLCLKQIIDWDGFWASAMKHKTHNIEQNFNQLMENLQLYEALKEVQKQTSQTDEYLAKNEPWRLNKDKDQETIVKILAQASASVSSIADMLKSFLPETSQKIKKIMDNKKRNIKQAKPLFPRK